MAWLQVCQAPHHVGLATVLHPCTNYDGHDYFLDLNLFGIDTRI